MNREKRGISTVLLVVVIAIAAVSVGAVVYISTRLQPNFQVENLSLSKDKVAKGDTVTAQVKVTNVGDAEGTHTVKLGIGNENLKKKVILGPGESETVDFDIAKPETGTYTLKVGKLSETFEVVEPAKFELSNLQVSPKEAKLGEKVTITLNVKNVGKIKGSHTVKMNIDGKVAKRKKVTLKPDEIEKVEFELDNLKIGKHSVEISGFSEKFEIKGTLDLKPYMENVSRLRNLEFKENISLEIISESKLRSYVENHLENQHPGGFRKSKLTLSAFGLFPRNMSLKSKLLELHTQEVVGSYISKKDKLFIVEGGSKQNLSKKLSKSVIIHELTHALQDQNFNLETLPRGGNSNDDISQSVTALVEGGATYTQVKYVIGDRNFDVLLEGKLATQYRTRLNSVTSEERNDNIPLILEKSLKFPYYAGTLFVNEIKHDGWENVNQAYSDLPSSTEQILHPKKYYQNRDYPVRLKLPQLISSVKGSWELLDKDSVGEYAIGVMFLKFFPHREAKEKNLEARNGWDGDTYKTFLSEKDNVLGLTWLTTWDSSKDAQEFRSSYLNLLKEKYPDYSVVSENTNIFLTDTPKGKVLVEKRNKTVLILEGFSKVKTNRIKEKIWSETTRQEIKNVERTSN